MPHIVVQCPSCTTKFSVEADALAAVQEPRFHCSRCDAVFALSHIPRPTMDDAEPFSESTSGESDERIAESASVEVPPSVSTGFSAAAPRQASAAGFHQAAAKSSIPAPIRQSDFGFRETAPVASSPENRSHAVASPVPSKPNLPPVQPPLEMTNRREPAVQIDQPATTRQTASLDSWSLTAPESTSASPKSSTMSGSAALSSSPSNAADLVSSAQSRTQDPASVRKAPPLRQARDEAADRYEATGLAQPQRDFKRGKLYGLTVVSLPLAFALILVLMLAYGARLSPDTVGNSVAGMLPIAGSQAPQLPPADLAVSRVKLQFIKVASGETIPVVNGSLTNRSVREVDGVKLEALAFDVRGELIVASQAPLRSALSRERVADLTLDVVQRFQISLNAKKSSIAAGEEVPFTIALLPHNGSASSDISPELLARLKYFSARVFSVKG